MLGCNERQSLDCLVTISDAALRAAQDLRRAERGGAVQDAIALDTVTGFLRTAASGGSFLAGGQAQFGERLEPLSWAADTYLQSNSTRRSPVDYAALASFLEGVCGTVAILRAGETPQDPVALETARGFFDTLADILAAKADAYIYGASQRLRGTLSPLCPV